MGILRFVTLNLWGENGPWAERLALVSRELGNLRPDVVALVLDDLDVTDALKITARRLDQNASITADTARITTDLGFSADYPIDVTNNGDVTIRVTGQNNAAAPRATASATVVLPTPSRRAAASRV